MNTEQEFRVFFGVLNFFGLTLRTASGKKSPSFLRNIIYTALALLASKVSNILVDLTKGESSMGLLVVQGLFGLHVIVSFFIILSATLKFQDDEKMWHVIKELDNIGNSFFEKQKNKQLTRSVLFCILIVVIFGLAIDIYVSYQNYLDKSVYIFLSSFIHLIYRLDTVHYLFFVLLLIDRLGTLKSEIKNAKRYLLRILESDPSKLYMMRKYHLRTVRLRITMERRFGKIILVSLLNHFYGVLANGYHTIMKIYVNRYGLVPILYLTWCILTFTLIGLVSHKYQAETKKIAVVLHNELGGRPKIILQVKRFSVQILMFEKSLTASRFFTINFGMLLAAGIAIGSLIAFCVTETLEEGIY